MLRHICATKSTAAPRAIRASAVAPTSIHQPTVPTSTRALVPTAGPRVHGRLRITDLQSGDTATVQRVFDGLSGRSRYLRFHAGRSTLPIRMQRGLADIRPGQHIAHVAAVGDRPVGLIRWIRFPDDRRTAELAVEVVDAVQRRGIGRTLIRWAARSALAAGIECFVGYFSPANPELRRWAIASGGIVDKDDDSLLRLPVDALLAAVEPPRLLPLQAPR